MRIVFALAAAAGLAVAGTPLAIQDVTVIDVVNGVARPHITVVIDGERIAAMDLATGVHLPANARIVIGRAKFLIPGLWDMHVHLWHKENQLPVFIAFGVTGVQDMGSDFPRVSAWREAIEKGKAIGPHVVTSGPPIDGRASDDLKLPVLVARTPDEARKAFDRLWDMDTDFVKILSNLPRDAYFALAEQARHWNLRMVGHLPPSVTVWEAIDARQRSLEHAFGVAKAVSTDEEALDLFERCAAAGVRLSPTLTLWRRMAHLDDEKLATDPKLKYVPQSIRKTWPALASEEADATRSQVEGMYRLVELMRRTNVGLLAGTDTGDPYTIPGATLHSELEELVAAGLTTREALEAATIAPARFLEWDEAMGTVEKGKIADLVLLDANPLLDIKNTRKIASVFVRGKYYSRRELAGILAAVQ